MEKMKAEKGNLDCVYKPAAIYYEESDFLEYIRQDVPSVYRRIDEVLTLVLDMYTRDIIGIKLKGFKNIYLRALKSNSLPNEDFILLTQLVEQLLNTIGNDIFTQIERRKAYESALQMAQADNVKVNPVPLAA